MEYLNWELSILSHAVAYPNLSTAAAHVGVSQPQLSRIVARLEKDLSVTLLDRESRRKSAWSPMAQELADVYSRTARGFRGEMARLTQGLAQTHLRIGTLEGLVPIAVDLAQRYQKSFDLKILEIDVQDQNELEEIFRKHGFDLILTVREPGRRKFPFIKKLGYQRIEKVESKESLQVMSTFEFSMSAYGMKSRPDERFIVSNSLDVRRRWLSQQGGSGLLPSSEIRSVKDKDSTTVLLIGSSELPRELWRKISAF